ncbi:MAG: hypothetical protein RLZZ217_2213 [Planctomycetota bacterium]
MQLPPASTTVPSQAGTPLPQIVVVANDIEAGATTSKAGEPLTNEPSSGRMEQPVITTPVPDPDTCRTWAPVDTFPSKVDAWIVLVLASDMSSDAPLPAFPAKVHESMLEVFLKYRRTAPPIGA